MTTSSPYPLRLVQHSPLLDETTNENSCTGSPTGHEYDDDGVFAPVDVRHLWPGSKPGDPCVWCLEDKP